MALGVLAQMDEQADYGGRQSAAAYRTALVNAGRIKSSNLSFCFGQRSIDLI